LITEPNMLIKFCAFIDKLVDLAGKTASWLVIPMGFLVFYDVLLRYIFNRPTVWVWDINVQFLGAMVAIGGAYTLLRDSHVGVDVITTRFSRKKQILIELATSIFFFLGSGVLLWTGVQQAAISIKTREVDYTYFAPPLYPLKALIAFGFFLLFLEGISKFIRNIMALRQGDGHNR